MTDAESIVSALLADSGELEFTGFVTNARVVVQSALMGEVWRHRRASPTGEFADGHRIQTSRITDVHIVGESVWVDTETGSRYGILSFSPTGLRDLLRVLSKQAYGAVMEGSSIDDRAHQLKTVAPASTKPKRRLGARLDSDGRHPLRPPANPDYIPQIKAHFDRQIAGIRSFQLECAQRTACIQIDDDEKAPQT